MLEAVAAGSPSSSKPGRAPLPKAAARSRRERRRFMVLTGNAGAHRRPTGFPSPPACLGSVSLCQPLPPALSQEPPMPAARHITPGLHRLGASEGDETTRARSGPGHHGRSPSRPRHLLVGENGSASRPCSKPSRWPSFQRRAYPQLQVQHPPAMSGSLAPCTCPRPERPRTGYFFRAELLSTWPPRPRATGGLLTVLPTASCTNSPTGRASSVFPALTAPASLPWTSLSQPRLSASSPCLPDGRAA